MTIMSSPKGAPNKVGRLNRRLLTNISIYLRNSTKQRHSYCGRPLGTVAFYRMVLFLITLNVESPLTTPIALHFLHFAWRFLVTGEDRLQIW